ncbi:MAG: cation-transporting P-type ATPase [Nitrospirae bacterium]|nr:MAG: cation-transporting P-type ATPase [Nitrospirota bacterium]
MIPQDTHHLPVHEVLLLLETDLSRGLSKDEAAERLKRFGPNVLPMMRRHGPVVQFLLQFHHPLVYILLAAGAITAWLGEVVDASVIFGVVVINAIVGFIQEYRAERALQALMTMIKTEATVLRDGRKLRISSTELVPGDVVFLESGDKVPADLRLVSVRELSIDESALTGESVAVSKVDHILPPETLMADRLNMAYSGTLVIRGRGIGIVVATGAATELGRIHQLVGQAPDISTPLTKKLAQFSKLLTVVILGLAAVTFGIGLWRGQPAVEVFMAAVALAVGAIPEGLPAAVTITLAIGVHRMAQRHAIIRKLPAVETLGSTTVICSDKTGTLTENQMTVQAVFAGGQCYRVEGVGYDPKGQVTLNGVPVDLHEAPALHACLVAGILCNESQLVRREHTWDVVGDPTEGALLVAARKAGLDLDRMHRDAPRVDVIPFESQYQYMATFHRSVSGEVVCYVKGALEKMLPFCTQELGPDGTELPLNRDRIVQTAEALTNEGLRVLAFARGHVPSEAALTRELVEKGGLTFLGLQAMIDPPRPEAIAAVRACHTAGIAVKMITGDHLNTARAIAEKIGILGHEATDVPAARLLTGAELATLPSHELPAAADEAAVFARVSPEQKLSIVEALQARRHIVAMTGDGVNDAPALKQADIGVAMGRSGTEVAKEAADMVLTDDNFASIEAAVEEGRGVFDNLTKFIVWTIPTNMGEGLVILAAIMTGAMLPILPVQILWINMTTAIALGLMLAFEPKEPDLMQRPPRDPQQPLLTGTLIFRTVMVSALLLAGAFGLFVWALERGASLAEARTIAVNVFVMVELFYLFNCRSLERSMFQLGLFSNPWVTWGVSIMIGLQLLFTYSPFMQRLFHSAAVSGEEWGAIMAIGLISYAIVGFEKWLRRRWGSRRSMR